MRVIVTHIEFAEGEVYYFVPLDGDFHYNAFATLLDKNVITGINVFTKEWSDIEAWKAKNEATGHSALIGESSETTAAVNCNANDGDNNNSRS